MAVLGRDTESSKQVWSAIEGYPGDYVYRDFYRDVGFEAVPLDQVLNTAERAKRLRLVILDACRDNPFAKVMKRTVASRAIGQEAGSVPKTEIRLARSATSSPSGGPKRARACQGLRSSAALSSTAFCFGSFKMRLRKMRWSRKR